MNTQNPNARLIIIFFVFIALYVLVLINLYVVQIKRARFFQSLAQKQYSMMVTSTPWRAEIFDRTGLQPLALNKESIAAFITPSNLEDSKRLQPFLEKNFKQAAERFKKNKKSHFLYVKRRLSEKEIELIQKSNLPDIKLLREPSRFYPIQSVGPIIGITNIDNQGLFGIELMCNETLAGKPSTYLIEKDCRSGFYFTKETLVEGTQGKPVTLTIDGVLQFLAYEELKDYVSQIGSKEGSILIFNPTDGDILVMANYPDFNHQASEDIDPALTKNRIITDAYELGSVIKAFLALSALEDNVVKPDEMIDCENRKSTRIHSWPITTTKANGIISFSDVIRESNNIGVAKVAFRVGPRLYDYYSRLGFGQKIGIFPGENGGFITPPERWSKASIISLSFGYEISANLLQLGQALGIIANNGYRVKPRLLKTDEAPLKEGPLFKQSSISQMREILRKTIDEGAAHKAHINGYSVIGKTGTARLITNGKYDHTRHIFTFMAIVEKGDYKRVVVIFLKETKKKGLLASSIAVPLFERVAHKMLIHDKIM
jgi:cell division protein FtsI (penicillin-binding protein 3)